MEQSTFTAHVISGSGRGKTLGIPTINADLQDVPKDLKEGIYACWVKLEDSWEPSAVHYGPRPVFQDTPAFEVHILDRMVDTAPKTMDIAVAGRLRPIMDFATVEELQAQITADVEWARAMLAKHGSPEA